MLVAGPVVVEATIPILDVQSVKNDFIVSISYDTVSILLEMALDVRNVHLAEEVRSRLTASELGNQPRA